MKVWFINPYGPIPTEQWREYRYTMLGKALSESGHSVIWWTANYSHHFKLFRSKGWKDIIVNDNFKIKLVPTTSYKSNFGIGRVLKDIVFAINTYNAAKKLDRPDLIIAAENPLTFGYPALKLAKTLNVKIVYDQMDVWPEFFVHNISDRLKPLINILMIPVTINRNKNYGKLDGILALAQPYLEFAINIEPNLGKVMSEVVYNGIDVIEFRALMNRGEKNFNFSKNYIYAVFAGTLGPSYDLLTLIEVAKMNAKENNNICIVVAGSGPFKGEITKHIGIIGDKHLKYVGKLKPIELCQLYMQCDIGLSAYTAKSNVEMPDKMYDYTAAGLPVINSLKGEVENVINNYEIGYNYSPGNAFDLYEKIKLIASRDVVRKKMGYNSLKCAMQYDKNVQNDKFVKFVEKYRIN